MEVPAALLRLAQVLKMRKEEAARSYNLLLTSTLSLTPTMLLTICQSDNWSVFRQYIQNLGLRDRLYALAPLLRTPQHTIGYRALARLVIEGYFSVILTTNIDLALEDALIATTRKKNRRVPFPRILVLGRDTDQYIAQALDDYNHTDDIHIVKLHGDLHDSIIPAAFPAVFELRQEVRESVQRYLNQDLIIAGSVMHDNDVNLALTVSGGSSIYYVHPHMTETDSIIRLIEERGGAPEVYVIDGQYGDFDVFFSTLEILLLSPPASSSEPDDESSVQEKQQSTYTTTVSPQSSETVERELPRADILLITVTESETRAVFDVFQETCGNTYERCFIGDKTYYDLGMVNQARIFLVQSEMGSSGPGASLLTVREGIQALTPSAIIMVGIAFGFDSQKQSIGDILVAQRLRGYELQRYGTDANGEPMVSLREDLVSASVKLLDRFRSGYKDWGGAPVNFGLILSGEKLVDNVALRDHLHELEPEAIGGEMEGMGLYAVAQRYKIDWILVKAICDWGDGKKAHAKSARQRKAARNAALFVAHVLQKTRLIN